VQIKSVTIRLVFHRRQRLKFSSIYYNCTTMVSWLSRWPNSSAWEKSTIEVYVILSFENYCWTEKLHDI